MCFLNENPVHYLILIVFLQVDIENPVGLKSLRTSDQTLMCLNDIRSKTRKVENGEKEQHMN